MTSVDEFPRPLRANGRFDVVSVGGTFEGLHLGHRRYLELAVALGSDVKVWVTGDKLAGSYKPYPVSPYSSRASAVKDFLAEVGAGGRCQVKEIEDTSKVRAFATRSKLDLAVVEPNYFELFENFNVERVATGLPPFYILLKPRTFTEAGDVSATSNWSESLND